MEVVAREIVREYPLALGMLFESPEYVAAMLAPPALLVDKVTWHEAAARVHVAGVVRTEVLPLPPLWLKVTFPVAPPEGYPLTVAVQVLDEPTTTGEGAQPTVTELGDRVTVNG